MKPLRLLSYNIRAGLGMDGERNLERAASVIRAFDPDLLVLQEVDRFVPRSGCIDQFDFFTQALGLHSDFAKTIDLQGGEYGIALFSKTPILHRVAIPLPTIEGHENRVLAGIEVLPEGAPTRLWWLGTHLARYSAPLRLAQAEAIDAFATAHLPAGGCTLLAGDFNASRHAPPLQSLLGQWEIASREALTYPSDAPESDIDHILIRKGSSIRLLDADLLPESLASDHRPIYVICEIEQAATSSPSLSASQRPASPITLN